MTLNRVYFHDLGNNKEPLQWVCRPIFKQRYFYDRYHYTVGPAAALLAFFKEVIQNEGVASFHRIRLLHCGILQ